MIVAGDGYRKSAGGLAHKNIGRCNPVVVVEGIAADEQVRFIAVECIMVEVDGNGHAGI